MLVSFHMTEAISSLREREDGENIVLNVGGLLSGLMIYMIGITSNQFIQMLSRYVLFVGYNLKGQTNTIFFVGFIRFGKDIR